MRALRRTHSRERPGRRRASILRSVAALGAAILLTSCGNEKLDQQAEVLPAVEIEHDQAIRQALAEVPADRLVALELRGLEGGDPVWRSEVATRDGTVHLVRTDASTGRLLSTEIPPAQDSDSKSKTLDLLKEVEILPEEAAREVTKPDFGKVTAIHLEEKENEKANIVWSINVATIEKSNVHVYDVDAVTGEILDRRSAAPPS
jgi:uncharacterized membrane protein YkoI